MRFFYGPVINPQSLTSYEILPRALLAVRSDGRIAWLERECDSKAVISTIQRRNSDDVLNGKCPNLTELSAEEFLIPGFVDTHTVRYLASLIKLRQLLRHLVACSPSAKYWKVQHLCYETDQNAKSTLVGSNTSFWTGWTTLLSQWNPGSAT